jgi:hypothetical protein
MKRLILSLAIVLSACKAAPPFTVTPAPPYDIMADLQHLSAELPLGVDVHISIAPIEQAAWGLTEFEGDHWEIMLDPRGGPEQLRETLIHEWAHALVGPGGGPCEDDHGPLWGVMYAACYRCVVERDWDEQTVDLPDVNQ